MKNITLTLTLTLLSLWSLAQTISSLPAATTLGGTEVAAGVQGGVTKKISINQIGTYVWASPTITGLLTTPLIKITSGSPGAGKVLTSDADGDATWETPSASGATAAGATGNVQYKSNGGGLQAEAAFSYDSATNTLDVDVLTVDTEAYDATGWNGDLSVPTKDAVRDKIETMATVIGAQDFPISSVAFWPTITNGCADLARTAISTAVVQTLDFDQTTQEFAQTQFVLPRNWNNGTITATVYWTAASGTGSVVWGISGAAYSNDDALSGAFGTAQTVTDALTAADDVMTTPTSSAITLSGSPADGDLIMIQISRNPADGSDTLTADAKLVAVRLTLTLDAAVSE